MSTNNVLLGYKENSCKIDYFGATLISWICEGNELIFVSSKSHYDGKKAIRGGIPLVFPCFGPWKLGPQHGFARSQPWKLEREPKVAGDSSSVVLSLEDNDSTRAVWNFKFKLLYTVTLTSTSLKTELSVVNAGSDAFDFTCLLHTYFKVQDVTKATISGLKGLIYVDKVKDGQSMTEERDLVVVEQNEDRIYAATGALHVLTDTVTGRKIQIEKSNLPDTVVWNPWKEKAAAMSDFGNDDYPHMICVEGGRVVTPASLSAGQTFLCAQTLTVL